MLRLNKNSVYEAGIVMLRCICCYV